MLMLKVAWIQMRVTMCLHIKGVGGDNIECLINLVFEFLRECERVLAYLVRTMLGLYV